MRLKRSFGEIVGFISALVFLLLIDLNILIKFLFLYPFEKIFFTLLFLDSVELLVSFTYDPRNLRIVSKALFFGNLAGINFHIKAHFL